MFAIFEIITALFACVVAYTFCAYGLGGAIIGAIACYFLPYDIETCLTWGFCIGMIIQLIADWRKVLTVVLSAIVGGIVGAIVSTVFYLFGASGQACNNIGLFCMLLGIWIGSDWIRERVSDLVGSLGQSHSSSDSSDGDFSNHPSGLSSCSNCCFYDSVYRFCKKTHRTKLDGHGYCSNHFVN